MIYEMLTKGYEDTVFGKVPPYNVVREYFGLVSVADSMESLLEHSESRSASRISDEPVDSKGISETDLSDIFLFPF